jgi:pimeloyl-ACP methyl ester carboxylesterase
VVIQPPVEQPNPNNPDSLMADFIRPQDKFLAYLACIVYGVRPHVINGAYIDQDLTSDRVAVWKTTSIAYIACKGTGLGTSTGFQDLIDDLALTIGIMPCNLSIVHEANIVVAKLQEMGYYEIHVCGHSLGGRAALCVATSSQAVKKCVALNAGAPAISPGTVGPGPNVATHYHICGDVISSHQQDATCLNIRVLLGPGDYYIFREAYGTFVIGEAIELFENDYTDVNFPRILKLDWFDAVWHGSGRFYKSPNTPWRYATPQEEQLSLENYFVGSGNRLWVLTIKSFVSLIGFDAVGLFQDALCENPIDGAKPGVHCQIHTSVARKIGNFITIAVGIASGIFLGLIEGGVLFAALTGAGFANLLLTGDMAQAIGFLIPGFYELSKGLQALIVAYVKAMRERNISLDDFIKAQTDGWVVDTKDSNLTPKEIEVGLDGMITNLLKFSDQLKNFNPRLLDPLGLLL